MDQEGQNAIVKQGEDEEETTYCYGLVKKKTLLLIWATIIITLANFGYFTGGYYAFSYFRIKYFGKFHDIFKCHDN